MVLFSRPNPASLCAAEWRSRIQVSARGCDPVSQSVPAACAQRGWCPAPTDQLFSSPSKFGYVVFIARNVQYACSIQQN